MGLAGRSDSIVRVKRWHAWGCPRARMRDRRKCREDNSSVLPLLVPSWDGRPSSWQMSQPAISIPRTEAPLWNCWRAFMREEQPSSSSRMMRVIMHWRRGRFGSRTGVWYGTGDARRRPVRVSCARAASGAAWERAGLLGKNRGTRDTSGGFIGIGLPIGVADVSLRRRQCQ